MEAAAIILILLAGAGTVYELTKPKPATNNEDKTPESPSSEPKTESHNPEIAASTSSIEMTIVPGGYDYNPNSFTLSGNYFTPNDQFIVYGMNGNILYKGTANDKGTFSITIDSNKLNDTTIGYYSMHAEDVSTSVISNSITIDITKENAGQTTNGSGGSNTTGPLSSDSWNTSSQLGSNTNPYKLDKWYQAGKGTVWYGSGFYQISTDSEEYFGTQQELIGEYNKLYKPSAEGTKSNPYNISSWQGEGYYASTNSAPVYFSSEANYENYKAYGINGQLYPFANGWKGAGYYSFTAPEIASLLLAKSTYNKTPEYIGSEADYNEIAAIVNPATSTSLILSVSDKNIVPNQTIYFYVKGNGMRTWTLFCNNGNSVGFPTTNSSMSYTVSPNSPMYQYIEDGFNEFYAVSNGIKSNSVSISINNTSTTSNNNTSTSSNNSNTSSTKYKPEISLSSNYIRLNDGAQVIISGKGFPPNTQVSVVAASSYSEANNATGIGIAEPTTNAKGEFTSTKVYQYNTTNNNGISALGNAFNQSGRLNTIYIEASTYSRLKSNVVSLTAT